MPIIYLSPSTQDWNHFVNGGTEEYYMNLIADAMEPYLLSSGIRWVRNTPDMTAASSIAQSNHGNYDLHLALHSNAAPEGEAGAASGLGGLLLSDERRREAGGRHHRGEPQGDLPLPLAGQDGPDHPARRGRQDARARRADRIRLPRQPRGRRMDQGQHRRDRRQRRLFADRLLRHSLRPAAGAAPGHRRRPGRAGSTSAVPLHRIAVDRAAPWNGDPIIVNGQWNNWYVVNFRGTVGYADSRYIRIPR